MVHRLCAVGFALLAVASPAFAAAREQRASVAFSGELTLTWQGDPARGCAAVGVCGYAGTVTLRPGAHGELQLRGGVPQALFVSGGSFDPALVRVRRDDDGSGGGSCLDANRTEFLGFDFVARGAGRWAPRMGAFGEALSSGRCAGPLGADVPQAVTAPVVDARTLARGGVVLRWPSGPFVAGPYSGRVATSLVARIGRPRTQPRVASRARVPRRRRGRTAWRTTGSWTYRVETITGELDAAFHGTGGAQCGVLDSCGVNGTLAFRVPAPEGHLEVAAERLARTPPRRDAAGRVVLRALPLYGETGLGARSGAIAASVQRPGAAPCAEQLPVTAPELYAERVGGRLEISLGRANTIGDEIARTHCPGPSQADVFGSGAVATAGVPLRALGRRELHVTLARSGAFAGRAYAGTRSGALTATLRLVRSRALHTVVRRLP